MKHTWPEGIVVKRRTDLYQSRRLLVAEMFTIALQSEMRGLSLDRQIALK